MNDLIVGQWRSCCISLAIWAVPQLALAQQAVPGTQGAAQVKEKLPESSARLTTNAASSFLNQS